MIRAERIVAVVLGIADKVTDEGADDEVLQKPDEARKAVEQPRDDIHLKDEAADNGLWSFFRGLLAFGGSVLLVGAGIGVAAAGIGYMSQGLGELINQAKGSEDSLLGIAGGISAIAAATGAMAIGGLGLPVVSRVY